MIRSAHRAAFLAAMLLAQRPAAAEVSVTFIAPERYTDAENRFGSGLTLRVTLAEVRRLFTEFGNRVLQPGQTLAITVLDIDLAGYEQPSAAVPNALRIVSDVGPPRFRLRYTLKERGLTVLSAEESVSDINFLSRYARSASAGGLTYERELIRDWLQARIVRRQPPRG